MEQPVPEVEGIITIVQESRFELSGKDGPKGVFLVAPGALENAALERLCRDAVPIRVAYTYADGLIAGRAHSVTPLGKEASR